MCFEPIAQVLRIFATSNIYTGNFGSLANADQICQSTADTAQLGGTWKAWLSDENSKAENRIIPGDGSYVSTGDGLIIANNWQNLTNGTLENPINKKNMGNK